MLKHSIYIFTFLSISFGANLCADLEDDKRTEETIQDKKRVDQQVEDKKVEQDLEQRRRQDEAIDRKRFEQQQQEKRRDRSDNASKSKNQIADKDDEQKKGNERDALKQPEEKGPMQERDQQKREEQQRRDEQKLDQQKREGRPNEQQLEQKREGRPNEQQLEQQKREVRQKKDEQQIERQTNQGERSKLKPLVSQPITKERFDKDSANWNLKGKRERDEFRKNRTQTHVFDKDYWDRYNKRTNKWHFKDNMNWWAPVAVPAIDNWLHIRGGRQRYYYYGDNGVIYYSDSNSYNNFIAVPGYNDFVYQGVVLARNIPKINYQDIQWMPVGVFTLTQTNESNRPNDYFTLAISPEGIVGGVYFNPQTNQNEEIEGMVDSQSFRVVWKFMSSDWPVFETGLFNLTQDESTAFIHYSEERTDSQLLIRLQQ